MSEPESVTAQILAELREMRADMATGFAGLRGDIVELRADIRSGLQRVGTGLDRLGEQLDAARLILAPTARAAKPRP